LCCSRRSRTCWPKKIRGGFGHHDFHNGLAETCGGHATGFSVGIATTPDERRIADAAGKLAAGPTGGSGRDEMAVLIESDRADGALLVAAMAFGGMGVSSAVHPRFILRGGDKFVGVAKWDTVVGGEALGAFRNEHHVRALFKHSAGRANGIFDTAQTGDGTRSQSGSIHNNGVAFDVAIEIQVRAEASVEHGIVFQHHDGGFDGIESGATFSEYRPTGAQGVLTAGVASDHSIIGNIPGAAVNNERGLHGEKISDIASHALFSELT
jgi:hypothetical protein